jgi:hypothetical protein
MSLRVFFDDTSGPSPFPSPEAGESGLFLELE